VEAAARALSLQILVHKASTSREIDGVFETFVRERPDAARGRPFTVPGSSLRNLAKTSAAAIKMAV
jgi:hypothetical protein